MALGPDEFGEDSFRIVILMVLGIPIGTILLGLGLNWLLS